ncbi:MAG: branched-chain amino acid ABC transporter substrate-binding protein [Candidatus Promineifilaceae bacterium]|nr:branched-chain amino acid ABC transporter substrate-binding protein [Candidatus Promineifilaceae bacterium]
MKRLSYIILLTLLIALLGACEADEAAEVDVDDVDVVDEDVEVEEGEELVCEDEIDCVVVEPGEPIRIASALVITGPDAQLGLDSQYGVEIAIMQHGEIAGHEVVLVAEDDQCSAEGGQAVAQKIAADPEIVGVIGTSCSSAGVPAAQILGEAGYVMISPSNTAPVLTAPETRAPGYFRTAHNDTIQGRAIATYAIDELGVGTAAAIHDGTPYTEGLSSVFRDVFQELGGEIVAFEAEAPDATELTPVLTSIAAAGPPEFLYYPVFVVLGSNITNQARQISELEGTILAGADGILSEQFLDAAGEDALGMYLSGPDLGFENEIYDDFLAIYESEFGTEPTAAFHAHAYDATMILLNAIEEVAIVGDDGTMLIPRGELREAIAATSGFEGITGTLTCDEFGDCADPQIAVNEVQEVDGEPTFVPIWTYEP